MRQLRPLLLAVAVAALAACSDRGPVAPPASPGEAPLLSAAPGRAVEGSYVVVLKAGADPRSVAAVAGVRPGFVYTAALNGFAAELDAGQLAALRRHPAVEYVEPDQVVTAAATQSSAPWGLDRIDQRSLPLDGAFTYRSTATGVRAYVLDTGIQVPHPEFGTRAQNVFDATGGNGQDCNGHGTAVASIVGGSRYGVAKGVRLLGVRALNCAGSGTIAQVIAAVDWVRVNHVKPAVANISLNGGASTSLNTAVTSLVNAGVFTAVAAGNSAADACGFSPSGAVAAYTVGASTITDAVLPSSNFGKCLDIYAPGKDIPTAWLSGGSSTLTGTSAAAPHVAGAAALYLASNPGASSVVVANWITVNATVGVLTGVPAGTPNRLLYIP